MPIYEYECEGCKGRLEVMQRLSDPVLEVCSTCNGKMRKLISAAGLMFKGAGWYVTDYARKSEKSDASAQSADRPSGDAKPGAPAKSDTPKSSESKTPSEAPPKIPSKTAAPSTAS